MNKRGASAVLAFLMLTSFAWGQTRDALVQKDRKTFEGSKDWIYNDLPGAIELAKSSGRPIMVVFRCIPCEACHDFDEDVAAKDPIVRDLMEKFVCVRIPQANDIDLNRFQYDFDQSFAVTFIEPDYTTLGRFGNRSERPEIEDMALSGLRDAMTRVLKLHASIDVVKPSLAGKTPPASEFRNPRDYPRLKGRYEAKINYETATAKSCLHCHQIREAERELVRSRMAAIPDKVLFPYPDPVVLGLKFDPKFAAKVERVTKGSIAEKSGMRGGDELLEVNGQPIVSVADLQWILHQTSDSAELVALVERAGLKLPVRMGLVSGWRRGDISWRVSTWDLRRMGLGGMRLDALSVEDRVGDKVPENGMALKARHVGEFGEHAIAKKAGVLKGDVIVEVDGRSDFPTESSLIRYAVQQKKSGDSVKLHVLRDGKSLEFSYRLP